MSSEPIFDLGPTENETVTCNVLEEVLQERQRQDSKWGQQNHPWDYTADKPVTMNALSRWMAWSRNRLSVEGADAVKSMVDGAARLGTLDFAGILVEEVAEAMDADTIEHAREELVQVAAVAVAAIESIDRNGR